MTARQRNFDITATSLRFITQRRRNRIPVIDICRRKKKKKKEKTTRLTSFIPSSLPRLLVPRSGGNAASCHPELHICTCSECTFKARALLLLLRLSNKCLALDLRTGAAGSSSGSLCTSQRDGDLKRRRGLVGEVTGEVSLWTRVPNMVIIRPVFPTIPTILPHSDMIVRTARPFDRRRVHLLVPTCTTPSSSTNRQLYLCMYVCMHFPSLDRLRAKSTGGCWNGVYDTLPRVRIHAHTHTLSLSLFLYISFPICLLIQRRTVVAERRKNTRLGSEITRDRKKIGHRVQTRVVGRQGGYRWSNSFESRWRRNTLVFYAYSPTGGTFLVVDRTRREKW